MREVLGVVLNGGQSRRFGSDKALVEVRGRPLIAHALDSLAPFANDLVVSGRSYGRAVQISDHPIAGLGPLGGLCGALRHATQHHYSHVLIAACDTPFIPTAGLSRLAALDGPCVVAEHPVIGFWPTSLASDLERFLHKSQRRSMRAWMEACDADEIAIEGIPNINRPADLEAYLAVMRANLDVMRANLR